MNYLLPIEETEMDRDLMGDVGIVASIISFLFVVTIFMC